jgi:6-phosphogluconolactonase
MIKGHCIGYGVILTILWMVTSAIPSQAAATQFWVYIGTYTRPPHASKGIYLYRLDTQTGEIVEKGVAAELADPGWQNVPPGDKFLYSDGSTDDHRTSVIFACRLDRTSGLLTLLNSQPTHGKGTTHVDVDPTGSCAVTANYSSGDISVLPINPDGTLEPPSAVIKHFGSSINPDRQQHPFPHSCNFDPSGKFVLVPDLGVDKVYIYRFDAAGKKLTEIEPAPVKPGSGPRHLSFHPNGKFVYLINEMGGTVTVFGWDGGSGRMTTLQTISTLPLDYKGVNTSAEVHLLPSGRFLYASNRGPNDLAIFAVDPGTGLLALKGFESTRGKGPRDFDIDPTGNFLIAANQDSDSVVMYRIDQNTGALTAMGDMLHIPSPICVTFVPVAQ